MNFFKSLLLSLFFAFAAHAAEPVNINTADAATMAARLNGVGESKAEAIVAYREEHGAFKSVDQLAQVKGIGLKTDEKNRELLTVGGAPAPRTAQAGNGKPSA
ncbi:MAG TPA: ComEA family DNA-binding protein [Xanthomonadales bacterium]|nr:ComEA family DNA-binding protein [Xanthomonadales bacterium]